MSTDKEESDTMSAVNAAREERDYRQVNLSFALSGEQG
jgi:hypothetical protein